MGNHPENGTVRSGFYGVSLALRHHGFDGAEGNGEMVLRLWRYGIAYGHWGGIVSATAFSSLVWMISAQRAEIS